MDSVNALKRGSNIYIRAYTICGTYHLMAPEMIALFIGESKEGYGHEVDYYSLGVMLYEAWSG